MSQVVVQEMHLLILVVVPNRVHQSKIQPGSHNPFRNRRCCQPKQSESLSGGVVSVTGRDGFLLSRPFTDTTCPLWLILRRGRQQTFLYAIRYMTHTVKLPGNGVHQTDPRTCLHVTSTGFTRRPNIPVPHPPAPCKRRKTGKI